MERWERARMRLKGEEEGRKKGLVKRSVINGVRDM
jgi:hypothetical protein